MSLVLVAAGPVCAEPRPSPGGRAEPAALLLERASEAERTTAYRGSQFVSVWGPAGTTTVMASVVHVPGQGTAIQVDRTRGTPGGTMFAAENDPSTPLTAPSGGALMMLVRSYDLAVMGTAQVAGRNAYVVSALRGDGSEAARFWLDAENGLLLRRQVTDSSGRIVRASAFLDIQTAPDAEPMTNLPPSLPEPWGARMSSWDLSQLRTSGWTCPRTLPGGLTLYEARRQRTSGRTVLHLAYSDGLSTVSLFVQRGRLEPPPDGYRARQVDDSTVFVRHGVTSRVVWSAEGNVYTLLADAPWETVENVVSVLPQKENRSWAGRVGHGLARVLSWLNPFG